MSIIRGWIPPRSCKQPKREVSKKVYVPPTNIRMAEYRKERASHISVGEGIGNAFKKQEKKYVDPILQKRDNDARSVRHTIAPISNKGAYQVITDEADFKTMGRKV